MAPPGNDVSASTRAPNHAALTIMIKQSPKSHGYGTFIGAMAVKVAVASARYMRILGRQAQRAGDAMFRLVRAAGAALVRYAKILARQARRAAEALGRLLRAVAVRTYKFYCQFESVLADIATDLLLFLWALRNFALLVGLEVALVMAAFRWPLLWLVAVAVLVLFITAGIEMVARRGDDSDQVSTATGRTRRYVHVVVLWSLRIGLIFGGITATVLLLRSRG